MNQLARRTMTFAVASLADPDGLKTSVASAATAQSYSGAALNGALVFANVGEPRLGGFTGIASWPTVTASASVGSYVASSTVVFTGTYGGQTVTRTATITSANGGATYVADGPLETVTSIAVAAQANASGSFTFGFTDIGPGKSGGITRAWGLIGRGSGTLQVGYPTGTDALVTTAGEQHPAAVSRIYATTNADFTVYEF